MRSGIRRGLTAFHDIHHEGKRAPWAHDGRAMSAMIFDLKGLRILTKKEVCALVPYTPQHIHRLEKAGRFPRRLQLGPNRVGWRLVDIEKWIIERTPAVTHDENASDEIPF